MKSIGYRLFLLLFIVFIPFNAISMQLIKSDVKNKKIWFKSDEEKSNSIAFDHKAVSSIPAFKDLFMYQGYQRKHQRITKHKKIKRINNQKNPLVVRGTTDGQLQLLSSAFQEMHKNGILPDDLRKSFQQYCKKQLSIAQCWDLFTITSQTGCTDLSRLLLPLCLPVDVVKNFFLIEGIGKHLSLKFPPEFWCVRASAINSDGSKCAVVARDSCWLYDIKNDEQPFCSSLDMAQFKSCYSANYVYMNQIGMTFNNDTSVLLLSTDRGSCCWNIVDNKQVFNNKIHGLFGKIFSSNKTPDLFASFHDGQQLRINMLKDTLYTAYLSFDVYKCSTYGLQWSPDDKYIVVYGNQKPSAARDTFLCIIPCSFPEETKHSSSIQNHVLLPYPSTIFSVAWSADSSLCAILSGEFFMLCDCKGTVQKKIDVIKLPTNEKVYTAENLSFSPGNIAFSKDGNYCFVEQVDAVVVVAMDTYKHSLIELPLTEIQKNSGVTLFMINKMLSSFTPDGLKLIVLWAHSHCNELVLYDCLTGMVLDSFLIDSIDNSYSSLKVNDQGTMVFLSHQGGIEYYSLYLSAEKHFGIY